MDNEEWDEDEEVIMSLLVTIYQMQKFLESEGYGKDDLEAYLAANAPSTLH